MTARAHHALAFLLLLPAAPALAQSEACGTFDPAAGPKACTCAAGPHAGSVWGSGPYTGDSDVCTAAVHAGVIGPEGGQVIVMGAAAPEGYTGTTANGVTTSDWGSYDPAFSFYGASEHAGLAECRTIGENEELTCTCPAGRTAGAVWGSGPYTADSDICTAAVHAGVLGPEGGEVTVRREAGQASYEGGSANGVTTSSWGSFGASIAFAR